MPDRRIRKGRKRKMIDGFTITEAVALLSDDGRRQLVEIVRQARETRAAGFLEDLKVEYPKATEIIDLIANHTVDECYSELEKQFGVSLCLFKRQIYTLHAALKAEINKPR